ncbi:MAG: hypothetical protein IT258_03365 [Saprospiraceae bacterium]|nr:hypothetical protein [Saprospiraceae bacterium]
MGISQKAVPQIRRHLLWEYDLDAFDYLRSKKIVIERIIERGNLKEWKEMLLFYGKETVLEVARASKQLDRKEKNFTEIFVDSEFNAA